MAQDSGLIPEPLRRRLEALPAPRHFFAGQALAGGLTPDHLLLFRRRDTSAFRPEGVMDNHHHRFELVLALQRSGPVRIGEATHLLAPGQAALIFPFQFHHYLDVEPGPMEWLFLTFELERPELVAPLRNAPRNPGSAALLPLVTRLLDLYGDPTRAVESAAFVSRLLRLMLEAPPIPARQRNIHATDGSRDLLLEKINRHVRAHLGEAMTIASLAAAIGYSEGHVRSVFRHRLGISLGRYIRHSRLSESARRLRQSPPGTGLAEIAQAVGFGSTVGFCHAFRKAYGLTPRRYARGNRHPDTPDSTQTQNAP